LHLETLEISRLRNISRLFLQPDGRFNWITGGNGAGKTTLLEAIYLLARGRSFRGAKHGNIVQVGQPDARIAGRFNFGEGRFVRIDFSRNRSLSTGVTNTNGVVWTGAQERPPVRVVGENAQRLLESGPEIRRLFLDWNLFHVEQSYGPALKRFRRILQQRNAWLKAGGAGCPVWDEPFLETSEEVTAARSRYVESLQQEMTKVCSESAGRVTPMAVRLDQGWPPRLPLADALRTFRAKDVERGYTFYGPSRADLVIDGMGVGRLGSRGQLKLAVCMVQIAADRLAKARGLPGSIWLLDDFPAELDSDAQRCLLRLFSRCKSQIFGTAIQFNHALLGGAEGGGRVFHVERGQLAAS
jgi:DNA replication and repair protein RecF